jgi:hypothetical protein
MRPNAVLLELKYPASVPVGHRVEIIWVKRDTSLFGEPEWTAVEGYCAVKDLDTGIEHGMASDFDGLDKQHPIAARMMGKVVWCRLVTIDEGAGQHTETRLYVEPEEGAPPSIS